MKSIVSLLLVVAAVATSAADKDYTPLQALEKFQKFTIPYGGYWYWFSRDGSFGSFPTLDQSGRTLRGNWKTTDGTNFTIIAEQGWMNNISRRGDYRRIVFHICRLRKQTPKDEPHGTDLFDGHYFIEEFGVTEKPPSDVPKTK